VKAVEKCGAGLDMEGNNFSGGVVAGSKVIRWSAPCNACPEPPPPPGDIPGGHFCYRPRQS
jgi:hypothetical protein